MTDSHCHIAGKEFVADLEAVVARARVAGVSRALVILAAEDDEEIARAANVRKAWPGCGFAVGVHPHNAKAFSDDPSSIDQLLYELIETDRDIWAVGEIGLDYHYDFSPREVQQAVFRTQLEVAANINMPVVIHTREAEDDTLRIIEEVRGRMGTLRGVFHCFTGDLTAAARALETGFYLSIPGVVTFPKAESLRNAIAAVPSDRLLVETDSPYLAPIPFRGKRNEPAHVAHVVKTMAAARGETVEQVGEQTDRNFDALFRP